MRRIDNQITSLSGPVQQGFGAGFASQKLLIRSSMKMRSQQFSMAWHLIMVVFLLAGCDRSGRNPEPNASSGISAVKSVSKPLNPRSTASPPIVAAARSQVGKTTIYDPAYVSLKYPEGDVPIEQGVCTDVVIRALRESLAMDLQKLLHEDMERAFSQYPTIWGLKKPDRNIDHRRVPNLRTYFQRKGYSVDVSQKPEDYLPGNLVTCMVGGNRPHIMIVSDKKTTAGVPFIIHNIGSGTREENRLFDFPITGHYRIEAEEQRRTKPLTATE